MLIIDQSLRDYLQETEADVATVKCKRATQATVKALK